MNPTTLAQRSSAWTKHKLPTAPGQSSTLSEGKKKKMFASLLTELKRASRYESEHESEREGRVTALLLQ